MIDLSKLTTGKNLSLVEEQVLYYIVEHIDDVMKMGVRGIASANYTSTSTIMRLTKKLGYSGFIDMHYKIFPLVKDLEGIRASEVQFVDNFDSNTLLKLNSYEKIRDFADRLHSLRDKYIFIYATGFSAIAAEYIHKKLLVLGKKCILASGMDSVGVFENNLEDMGLFIAISKSGETKLVLDKIITAKENKVPTAAFTGEIENSISSEADVWFRIEDSNKLDDRNTMPNIFFPNVLMITELIVYEYHRIMMKSNEKV